MAFAAHGDDVLWATATDSADRVREVGLRSTDAGMGEREAMAVVFADPEIRALEPAARPPVMGPRLFGRVRAPRMLSDLLPIATEFRPDLIVGDAMEFASPIVAAKLSVRNLTHSFGPLLPASRVAATAELVAPLWEQHGLQARPFGGIYDHLYLDVYPATMSGTPREHLPRVQAVRPVEFETGADEPLPDWLTGAGRPLVYITMGTVFSDSTVLSSIISGVRDLDVRVLVTVGPHWEPDALGEQPPNVHLAKYVPQRQILRHCAAVVSHGGSGTFLACVAAGLPQLIVAQGADQFLNAAAGQRRGVSLSLDPSALDPNDVTAALERLLGEDSFRTIAALVAAEIAAMPAPAEVAKQISDDN